MTITNRYLAAALAVAVGGAIAAAPAASAAPATPHPTAPPTPPGDGSDPLVPSNTGANPFVFIPHGDELPG